MVRIIVIVLVLHCALASFAQTGHVKVPTSRVAAIKAYLNRLEKLGYSGAAMIAINGKPAVSKGFGYSDMERKIRNSPHTIFDTGSLTKQFTATAILKLEVHGKLSTDDPISKYFANVPQDKAEITIHDLLRHSSGLPGGVGGDYEKISEAEFLEKVFAAPLRFPAGTRFSYSNVGYSLLALIIEKVSGQGYEQYMYANLWKPAGMEMTGYSRPRFDKNLIAVGYREAERWGQPTDKEWAGDAPYLHLKGNGGVLSTTGDLLKWDQALFGESILSKGAKQKLYFPRLRENETGRSHYGYGWDVFKTGRNTTRIWHNGSNRVFYADFYRFIEEGVTIILMTNRAQESFNDTGLVISRIIFEPDYLPPDPIPFNQSNKAFTDQIITLVIQKGLEKATEAYQGRRKGINLVENVVNAKGYDLLNEKKWIEAIGLFKLNAFAFPRSANAFDSLGEAYLESGDRASAIENYKKSLSLDPENDNARAVIGRLQKQ